MIQEESYSSMTLYELNHLVSTCLNQTFTTSYWVQAELSDVRINANGHCYLELIQQDEARYTQIAKARAIIWARTLGLLKPYFEETTGESFSSGLKVLVCVEVKFHELYGYSLVIVDIDPTYTMGERIRRRQQIISQLQKEGILTLNKELKLPTLAQHIAVISSPTAAGYGDFMNQLKNNAQGFTFYTRLFSAVMQGERIEESIIHALNEIFNDEREWDVVVIIRGGGATSDLTGFDTYELAVNCAQFPIPIITGIGHERDETVLDLIAHTRVKTPTAAAEFLMQHLSLTATKFETLSERIVKLTQETLIEEKHRFERWSERLSTVYQQRKLKEEHRLEQLKMKLPLRIESHIEMHQHELKRYKEQFSSRAELMLLKAKGRLALLQHRTNSLSPDLLLKRGYSITLKEGKVVTDASQVIVGDKLVTRFAQGEVESQVTIKK